jgi:hypothetical protein
MRAEKKNNTNCILHLYLKYVLALIRIRERARGASDTGSREGYRWIFIVSFDVFHGLICTATYR